MPTKLHNCNLNSKLSLDNLKINHRSFLNQPDSEFSGLFSMENQSENLEIRNIPETFTQLYN